MNIQRFIAPTSREAMSKARRQFGDSAVILSTRQTADGFEVMAAAEESLAGIAQAGQALSPAPAVAAAVATAGQLATAQKTAQLSSVGSDTEAMAMSTRRALSPCGFRKRSTVLEIASTPVNDEPPLANARSSVRIVAPMTSPLPCCTDTVPGRWAGSYTGSSPTITRTTPTTIIRPIMVTKA